MGRYGCAAPQDCARFAHRPFREGDHRHDAVAIGSVRR